MASSYSYGNDFLSFPISITVTFDYRQQKHQTCGRRTGKTGGGGIGGDSDRRGSSILSSAFLLIYSIAWRMMHGFLDTSSLGRRVIATLGSLLDRPLPAAKGGSHF